MFCGGDSVINVAGEHIFRDNHFHFATAVMFEDLKFSICKPQE